MAENNANSENTANEGGWTDSLARIPRTIPMSILFAILVQVGVVIWGVSSFYKESQITQATLTKNFETLQSDIAEIKGSIYTRQEAVVLERKVDKLEERITYIERRGHPNGISRDKPPAE